MGRNQNRQTAVLPFRSKKIAVYRPSDGQKTVVASIGGSRSAVAQARAAHQFFRVLEALVVKPSDWEWMEDQLISGEASVSDYTEFMKGILEFEWDETDDTDEDE